MQANNGREGFELIKNHQDEYDIIILDLIMPGKDGLYILESMKHEGINKKIIVATSNNTTDVIREVSEYGINYYILKPFEMCDLEKRILDIMNREYEKKVIDIEDKVNYILQNVLQFRGKDRIHSMVVYLPLVSNKKLDYMWKNKYPVRFIDGNIYNSCRSNAEKLMYETYNSTRSLYDVINYFNENDTISKLNEWAYCFKFV